MTTAEPPHLVLADGLSVSSARRFRSRPRTQRRVCRSSAPPPPQRRLAEGTFFANFFAGTRDGNRMANGTASTFTFWIKALTIGRSPQWTLVRIGVLVVGSVLLFKYGILLRRIESISMSPTLREGSVHLVNRLSYLGSREPRRGDIVAIRTSGETVLYVKRIIGLPGETIAIRRGTVYIDGQPLEEPYVPRRRPDWNRSELGLGPGEYFIIGDNRSMDQDLHVFGRVDGRRIVGKVVW